MRKLLTTLAAVSALALGASVAQAECMGHNVTASKAPVADTVSVSTHDEALVPPVAADEAKDAQAATTPVCAEDDKSCTAGTE